MKFNFFLAAYYPDTNYGAKRHFNDMVEQAQHAEHLGFSAVSIPEHHLVNLLLTPSPLQMAVKVASVTNTIDIITSIAVLPLRDMRIFAGELIQADVLCNNRLILGMGRGAFKYEMERLGVPMDEARDRFDESLNVLQALLAEEEVGWDGKYYKFDPITVMPRPDKPIQLMVAAMAPEAIYHSTKRGFHIQTAPLAGSHEHMLEQVAAFHRAKDELGAAGEHLRLSVLRNMFLTTDANDTADKIKKVEGYFERFDNVFTGPGIVERGAIKPLPRKQSIEDLEKNVLCCPTDEMIEKLSVYADAGIEEIILNTSIGCSQTETLEMMARFSEEVMPHFKDHEVDQEPKSTVRNI